MYVCRKNSRGQGCLSHQEDDNTETVHLSYAFNSLNRQVTLHNIRTICPTILINTYLQCSHTPGFSLPSKEGTHYPRETHCLHLTSHLPMDMYYMANPWMITKPEHLASVALSTVLFLDSISEGEAWYTLTAHVLDLS